MSTRLLESRRPFTRLVGDQPSEAAIREYYRLVDFQPNPHQEEILFARDGTGQLARAVAVAGGEQAGKSLVTSKWIGPRMLWAAVDTPGWIVAPDYAQAHPEMLYLIQDYQRLGLLDAANTSTPKEGKWWITLKGGIKLHSLSAQDEAKLAGERPYCIALVEAGQCSVETYYRCFGRTAPAGGWLMINGTYEKVAVEGEWYPELIDAWSGPNEVGRSFALPSWSNEALYPGGLANPEIQRQRAVLPEDVFQERFGGRRMPPRTLVFPEFRNAFPWVRPLQLGGVAKDPQAVVLPEETPLQVWIDPGWAGAYAVLFAALVEDAYGDPRVYILDEIYTRHQTHAQVIELARAHRYWPYVTHGVMDPAGLQHHGHRSAFEIWQAPPGEGGAGIPLYYDRCLPKVRPQEGIDRIRSLLLLDQRFDPPEPRLTVGSRCRNLIWELTRGYRYPEGADGQPRDRRDPLPENNHAISALWFGLIQNLGYLRRPPRRGPLPRPALGWAHR